MSARVSLALVIAVFVPLTGCDWSQKKPETRVVGAGSAMPAVRSPQLTVPVSPGFGLQTERQGGVSIGTEVGGEKSIRLYGPGVSRKRQTRV